MQVHQPPTSPDGYAASRYGQLLNATNGALWVSSLLPEQHNADPGQVWQLYATNNADHTKRASVYQDGKVLFVLYAHDVAWDEGEEWAAEGFADAGSAREYADALVR
jgi:hypothetical protein